MLHHTTLDLPQASSREANDDLTLAGSLGVLAAGLMAILALIL